MRLDALDFEQLVDQQELSLRNILESIEKTIYRILMKKLFV